MPSPSGSGPIDAESLYAAWRDAASERSPSEFEELCRNQPLLAAELRSLHAKYEALGRVLGSEPESPAGGAGAAADEPFRKLVERLERHRPTEDRYEEGGEIGKGGMGRILEAYDVDLRRVVAKKVMLGHRGMGTPSNTAPLVRFCEEAQVTAQLTHPGVVPVHELGIDPDGQIFFTMDRVRGRTLQAIFELAREEREGWNIPRAVGVVQRVCDTLAYAHSKGVVHRDIKPSNVMVGEFGEVYVMDWGLARLMGSQAPAVRDESSRVEPVSTDRRDASDRDTYRALNTETGTVVGTPGFMAPEQARGDVHAVDHRTDVYAAGALLYSLLTGVRPYEDLVQARDYRALVVANSSGSYARVPSINADAPAELVSITDRAMAWKPEDRYESASAMSADVRAWLEGRVVKAHESGAWAELRKWVRRNRALAASIAAAALAVTGGASGMAVIERKGRIGLELEQLRTATSAAPTLFLGLMSEPESIWPSLPSQVPAIEDWLSRKAAFEAQWPIISSSVQESKQAQDGTKDLELDPELLTRLADISQGWAELEARSRWMEARLAIARSVNSLRTQHDADWQAVAKDLHEDPRYSGLVLEPQLGLVPLRKDPESGLWEFWHILSGERPQLDGDGGGWIVTEEMGVVLVLIPPVRARVGAMERPRGDPLFDEYAENDRRDSNPLSHEVDLSPFFISKYELTQAQWRRARGRNDSQLKGEDETHPADTVSWDGAVETLTRFDLVLPTEAQWEIAARAGMDTRFATGQDPASLKGHVILYPDLDDDGLPDKGEDGEVLQVWERPYLGRHEAVGSTLPNGYGLHDVHGNVWEWCLDSYDRSAQPRKGDGLRLPRDETTRARVYRGGGYKSGWWMARLSYRWAWQRQNGEPDTGVRPARAIR